MAEPAIVLAHSPRGWAQDLHFFLMDHGGAVVRGYVMSPEDALAEEYAVLIVDDTTSFLSPRLVSELQRRGTRVVGIFDADDAHGTGKQRLLDVGVDEALPLTVTPPELLEVVNRIAGPPLDEADIELSELLDEMGVYSESPTARTESSPPKTRRGHITAVAACSGGSGATEIAIGLASAFRLFGEGIVLMDLDDQAPSIAQRLGLALHPNVRTAVDTLQHGAGPLEHTLLEIHSLGLEVLVGLPNPRDWFELRSGEVAEVALDLARTRERLVANVGSRIDDLPELGGPARFGVSRAMVGLADATVLVSTASPIGVTRVMDWLAAGQRLVQGKPLHIVLNQYPGGKFVKSEIENELLRNCTPSSVTFVPHDKRVTRAAWEGEPVPKGPFTKGVARLAAAIPPIVHAEVGRSV